MPERPEPQHQKRHRGSLAMDEIHRRYNGEWVIVHVTAFDERQVPKRGKVLFHSPDQDEVDRAVPPQRSSPGPLYVFLAEPRPPFGPEDVKGLEELVARLNAQLEAARAGMA